jgi:hypothetical protein
LRGAVKRLALGVFRFDLAIHRWRVRRRGQDHYRLAGACRRSGACCREPGIQVGAWVWHVRSLRWLFLWWQRAVNGFELTRTLRQSRAFVFRCTHFDEATLSCDSYATRPGMCRDYPRLLLDGAHPEFHAVCGFRAIPRNAESLARALDATGLSPAARAELKRKLRVLD